MEFRGTKAQRRRFEWGQSSSANFSDAKVDGVSLDGTTRHGFTAEQFYSTASYKSGNLRGIHLAGNNLSAWNFANKNLAGAVFESYQDYPAVYPADLNYANFTGAILSNAMMDANLTGATFNGTDLRNAVFRLQWDPDGSAPMADFTAADTRGAQNLNFAAAITHNTIRPNGHIRGLDLTRGQSLLIRNYVPDPHTPYLFGFPLPSQPLPIIIEGQFTADNSGKLTIMLDADHWESTISFAPGIPVSLSGMLELAFADGIDAAAQVDRTIRLFDWSGVTPIGTFDVAGPYTWDVSQLYTAGDVTLKAVPEPACLGPLIIVAGFFVGGHRQRLRCAVRL